MDLKLGHYAQDGIEVIDVQGEIDMYTAPRLRELLIDLISKGNYQLVVNLDKVGFLDSTGLGVLVGGLKRVRVHDGSLDLVCTQQRILRIFRITGLTEVATALPARVVSCPHCSAARRPTGDRLGAGAALGGSPSALRRGAHGQGHGCASCTRIAMCTRFVTPSLVRRRET